MKLSDRFGGASAFFCNSGAEAIEAALKWARKATGRTELVALDGSFHGRTFGALSVTGQPAKRAAFEPLVPGAKFGLEHVGPNTAAIILEPVQGEGGVHPLLAGVPRRGARARRRARRAADLRRGADGRRPHAARFFAWQELRREARRGHARQGSCERAADRRAARLRRRRRPASSRATTPRRSAATRHVRRRVRRARHDRRRAARARAATISEAPCARRVRRSARARPAARGRTRPARRTPSSRRRSSTAS